MIGIIVCAIIAAAIVVAFVIGYMTEGTHTGPITLDEWDEWYEKHGLYQSGKTKNNEEGM